MQLTHLGGPTVLVEFDGWRILTDPTFDPPGRRYSFGWGTASRKTAGPAIAPDHLGPLDLILVSHEQHADNLDARGRDLLPTAATVLTTAHGARRLGANARGLSSGESVSVHSAGKPDLTVRATPCRHGPPLSQLVAGPVIGFALSLEARRTTALWVTGDTVLYPRLRAVARTMDVDVALLHLGGVQFGRTGPLRYSMNGADAVQLLELLRPRVAVPVHYEGWSHFREPVAQLRRVIGSAPQHVADTVHWLEPGQPRDVGPDA